MIKPPLRGSTKKERSQTVLDAGGYEIIGRIVLDGAASRKGIPQEIAEESRKLGAQLAQ